MVLTTDVLVVGAGPTGLSASALLARYGVPALTITKHPTVATTPRAHITNQKTVEIFREIGIEKDVVRAGIPIREFGDTVWATSFSGTELARLHAWGTGPDRQGDYADTSPCEMINLHQHLLEPILVDGARSSGADIRFGAELIDIVDRNDHVLATIRDHADGSQWHVQARYVIGADGSRSTVSGRCGFGYSGDTEIRHWAVNVWLEADLTEHCSYRPGTLYWIYPPGSGLFCGTWMCVQPWTEWVMTVVYPAHSGKRTITEAEAVRYAREMISDTAVGIRIRQVSHWGISHRVATQYRRGSVFLAGDSAHQHPPPNGLGLNTGVQDAHNLCWKLAMVLSGKAGDDLLDTYELERLPVGRQVVQRAMSSLANLSVLTSALGLEPDQAAREGLGALAELVGTDDGAAQRREQLRAAIALQHYQFNCHGVEYGPSYRAGAFTAERDGERDPELYHRHSTAAGCCLPHAWIEHHKNRISTLDAMQPGAFTVITGIGGEEWRAAAMAVSRALGLPISVVCIDYRQEFADVYGRWAEVREIGGSGCLLVRPDRYIAWQCMTLPAQPRRELERVMRNLLGTNRLGWLAS